MTEPRVYKTKRSKSDYSRCSKDLDGSNRPMESTVLWIVAQYIFENLKFSIAEPIIAATATYRVASS
jgi:hypothetical protein